MTHLLQRLDETLDSKRFARKKKLQILSRSLRMNEVPDTLKSNADSEPNFNKLLESPIHFRPESFPDHESDEIQIPESNNSRASGPDLERNSESNVDKLNKAINDDDPLALFQCVLNDREVLTDQFISEDQLIVFRSKAMERIFQRMHSGTVKDDVPELAQIIVDLFPDSKESQTLRPVMSVLRRAAGLCPRCSKPYKGIANACHECLAGTSEAYQIAWDENP